MSKRNMIKIKNGHLAKPLLSLKKLFRSPLLPVFSFLISLLALSLSAFYLSHQSPAFATPPPPPTPITLSASISHPVVTLNFKAGDLATSAFKQFRTTYDQITNNPTGATSYISSVDEETSLTPNLTTVPQKIETISSELSETNFTLNHWGYRSNQVPGGTNVNFKPIPKASSPDLVISTQDTSNARAHIDFGARLNLSLPAGTYSKNILLTAITNHVPKTSKFLPGPDFHDSIKDLVQTIKGSGQQIHLFKRADSPPGAVNPLKTVSTLDSERPIYMWYDSSSQTIYWHSDADVSYMNEDGSYMFRTEDIPGLGGVDLDLRSINTSRTTDMSYMFQNAKAGGSLASINISEFNTSRVKNMSHMFEGTDGITSLDLSSFNTSEVEDMSYMFKYDSGHTQIENFDLSNFNTSKVKNMSHMFDDNRGKHFNLSSFDTKNVLDMSHMFSYAEELTQLDLSSFNTEKVTNMSHMFESTLSLQNLNLSNFNTGNVTDMSYMFRGTYLPQLDL